MNLVEAIGLIAGVCTTISFIPQVRRTLRTRSTGDLSLSMFLVFTVGVVLWLIYGILIKSMPIILANGVTFLLTGTILISKILFGRKSINP